LYTNSRAKVRIKTDKKKLFSKEKHFFIKKLSLDVEKGSYLPGKSGRTIIDKGIENTRLAIQWNEVVIGNSCRNQGAMAFL
jgi:hypothetical protein